MQEQETYLIEAEDGTLVSVPADRLESWEAAQKQPAQPLSRAQRRLADSIRRRIFG